MNTDYSTFLPFLAGSFVFLMICIVLSRIIAGNQPADEPPEQEISPMSKSKHDRRGRPHSDKRCPEAANGGCVYCRTGEYKRADRRTRRAAGKREAREQHNEN